MRKDHIGKVQHTSTVEPLKIRLNRKTDIESILLGGYLTIAGKKNDYITKIVDIYSREITKGTTDIQMQIGEFRDAGITVGKLPLNIMGGLSYEVTTKIIRSIQKDNNAVKQPKTAPPVLSFTYRTNSDDILKLYKGDIKEYVEIGELRGIIGDPVPVQINLNKMMTLHGGIFAKTGSGKTVLAKILIGHIIARKNKAALVFDMHGEYGYKPSGLKQYFKDNLIVVGLKEKSANQGALVDETLEIPRSHVTLQDIDIGVKLSDAQQRALHVLVEHYGEGEWFDVLMEEDISTILEAIGETGGIQDTSLRIAKTNVARFFDNLPFIVSSKKLDNKNSTDNILKWLMDDKTVVISFGTYSNDPNVYAVATNMISKRLLELYREKYDQSKLDEMPQVLILLEEAHKFLNKSHLNSSFFGSFVREARKFKLGLLLVDQSPSKLHEEVIAQLGTQFIMQLGNEKDKKMVIDQSEEDLSEYKREITSLNPREGLVVGKASDFLQSFNVLNFDDKDLLETIWKLNEEPKKTGSGKKVPEPPLGGI